MTLTILDQHIEKFEQEFSKVNFFQKKKEHQYEFSLPPSQSIELKYLDPGVFLSSPFHEMPKKNLETFFMHLMQGNYLGQGTGRTWISLEPNEKFLTLSMAMPYEVNYVEFKEMLEEFMNYFEFWKAQVEDFIKKQVD